MLSQADRIAFSLKIVGADAQVAAVAGAQAQVASVLQQAQNLDNANANLFNGANDLVNLYQTELNLLDGNLRTTVTEQDVKDAANKKLRNFFFPNDTSVTVPSLASLHNVWIQFTPFALSYGVGKNYTQSYSTVTKEGDLIGNIISLITSAGGNADIENTTGQTCGMTGGTCSLPSYTTESTCVTAGGVWTGVEAISDSAQIHTLLTNLTAAVTALQSFATSEAASIPTTDTNPTNSAQNAAALAYINSTLLPALAAWLANPDFNTAHGQTTCAGFYAYHPALLAPTKLYSGQLSTLLSALNARSAFITTRIGQLNTILGDISQDLSTGVATYTGLYGRRYSFLDLRLNVIGGSLSQLTSLQSSSSAQTAVQANIVSTKNTYYSILPTSAFGASANGTGIISVKDASFLSVGDQVYVYAEDQVELVRAVKAINGKSITLNDSIPAKYTTASQARIYKDLT